MKLLNKYDAQLARHAKETQQMNLPLLSWDFHLNNLNELSKTFNDIFAIKKITNKLTVSVDLIKEFKDNSKVIVITSPDLEIEFASSNILEMTGYLPSELIENSPKMFQGENTDDIVSRTIRNKVNKKQSFEAVLLNYRKDNSEYNCQIKGYPIFNKKGALIKYAAVEQEVA